MTKKIRHQNQQSRQTVKRHLDRMSTYLNKAFRQLDRICPSQRRTALHTNNTYPYTYSGLHDIKQLLPINMQIWPRVAKLRTTQCRCHSTCWFSSHHMWLYSTTLDHCHNCQQTTYLHSVKPRPMPWQTVTSSILVTNSYTHLNSRPPAAT